MTDTFTYKTRFDLTYGRFTEMIPHDEPFSDPAFKARLIEKSQTLWYADHPLRYMSINERIALKTFNLYADTPEGLMTPQMAGERREAERLRARFDEIKARRGYEMWSPIILLHDDIRMWWGERRAPASLTRLHLTKGTEKTWTDEVAWGVGTLKAFKDGDRLYVTYEEPAEYSRR